MIIMLGGVKMSKSDITIKKPKDGGFYFLIVIIAIGAIVAFIFTEDNYKVDAINQLTNISLMFIFPMLAVLIGIFAFVQKSQTKELILKLLRFVTYDVVAIGLGYIISSSLAYIEKDISFKYIAYILQLAILLYIIFLIRKTLIDLLTKLNVFDR